MQVGCLSVDLNRTLSTPNNHVLAAIHHVEPIGRCYIFNICTELSEEDAK